MKVTIIIENVGGIFYINHKRLGHDKLSDMEKTALNEFIKEYKEVRSKNIQYAREMYKRNEITFKELDKIFFENASDDDLERFYKAPVYDRPMVIEGLNQKQRDEEFNRMID